MPQIRRIALVSPGWPPGHPPNGIVSYTARLRTGLEALGVTTEVVANRVAPGGEAPYVTSMGFETFERGLVDRAIDRVIGIGKPLDAVIQRYRVRNLRRAIAELRSRGPLDLIQIPDSFGLSLALKGLGIPIVNRLHGPWFLNGPALGAPQDANYAWRVQIEGQAIAEADAVAAPSFDVLNQTRAYYKLPLTDASVTFNPIDDVPAEHHWSLANCDRRAVLFVGRFDRHKGGDVALRAWSQVLKAQPDATLLFAGPDRGFVDDAGRKHSLPGYLAAHLPQAAERERVQVLGQQTQEQILALRKQALVTIVPSRYETFGNTALEAMLAGCPLIASQTGGLAEIVQDGRNGILVAPGDPDALAKALVRLLSNPDAAAALGRQAREDVLARHSPEAIARQTMDFYVKLMDSYHTPGRSPAPRERPR